MSRYLVTGKTVTDYRQLADQAVTVSIDDATASQVVIQTLTRETPIVLEGAQAEKFLEYFVSGELKKANILFSDTDPKELLSSRRATTVPVGAES